MCLSFFVKNGRTAYFRPCKRIASRYSTFALECKKNGAGGILLTNNKKITTMKKIVLALALVGGTLASNAQVYLGGKLGLWGTKDVKTEVTLAPEIGYKLSNNTAIGTSISYTLDDPKGDKNNSSVFEFNPYLRYTACRVGAVSFIVDGALGFNWASQEAVSGSKFGWSVEKKGNK